MNTSIDSAQPVAHMLVWNDFCHDARVLKEAQTLQAAGYQVTVHAVHAPGRTARVEQRPEGIRVHRASWYPGRKGSKALMLLKQVLARLWWHGVVFFRVLSARPDVVHGHDVNTLPTAWLAARLSGARFIYDAHEISTDREGYRRVRGLVAWLEARLMPRSDGVITTTDARARFFARAYGVPRPLVLQNRPRFTAEIQSTRIRDELQLDKPWPIVLYQGGLQSGRGLDRLVRAANHVPDAYFVFIGSGAMSDELQRLADSLQLSQRIHFISAVPLAELPDYTAAASIGVQPIENTCLNHFTTDSNKLFEYVQAGLPVIASDLPEIRKVVREYELGVLIKPGDSGSLVDALGRMVGNERLRSHYATRAREAAQVLCWEKQEQGLLDLYQRVLLTGRSTTLNR